MDKFEHTRKTGSSKDIIVLLKYGAKRVDRNGPGSARGRLRDRLVVTKGGRHSTGSAGAESSGIEVYIPVVCGNSVVVEPTPHLGVSWACHEPHSSHLPRKLILID